MIELSFLNVDLRFMADLMIRFTGANVIEDLLAANKTNKRELKIREDYLAAILRIKLHDGRLISLIFTDKKR